MGRKTRPITPRLGNLLKEVGENIKLARLRRRITTTMLAERAGMTRATLRSIERGDLGVTMGAYANVLFSLGLHGDLAAVARDDDFGRRIQDAALLQGKTKRKK